MGTKLFVRSLPYATTDDELAKFFESAGSVKSAKIIFDRETNRSKGYGFVEMNSEADAEAAVRQLNGQRLDGRTIFVDEARPKPDHTNTFAAA